MDVLGDPLDVLGDPLDVLGDPLDALSGSLDDLNVPMDLLYEQLGDSPLYQQMDGGPLFEQMDDGPLYGQMDGGRNHNHHHLRTCHLQLRGRILGTRHTVSAHSRTGRACDSCMDDEAKLLLDASPVHPSLATQTIALHRKQHHSHCNSRLLLHCSLPSLSQIIPVRKQQTFSMGCRLDHLFPAHFASSSDSEDEGSV